MRDSSVPKRHGRPQTPAQRKASERNWLSLRLRGAEALLHQLAQTSVHFAKAIDVLQEAMIEEGFDPSPHYAPGPKLIDLITDNYHNRR